MTLDELIAELRRRKGSGCRDLEWWIWWRSKANVPADAAAPSDDYVHDSQRQGDTPAYTISIDAAIKLVPDGMRLYSLGYYPGADGGGWFAGVANDLPPIIAPPATSFISHAPTAALALCISSLMARKYLIDASLCDDIRAEARAEGATEMTTPRKIISG